MGFGALRVLNEDLIAPNSGFNIHPHKDMEIVTIMKEGTISHKDTEGNAGNIPVGMVQRMSAGKGIWHSEMNMSKDDRVHLFQVWIDTKELNIQPSYEEFHLDMEDRLNNLIPVASGYGNTSGKALYIHQNAEILLGHLDPKNSLYHSLRDHRNGAFIQVTSGDLTVNGKELSRGDALEVKEVGKLNISSIEVESEFMVFDVPLFNNSAS
jgi:redox-sensitive bicupin YhaK (pirin superfamily)